MSVHWNRRRQIFRIMKLTTMMCVCFFCTLSANVMSQERLSMRLGEVTIKQVFEEIRRQTDRIVICNDDRLDLTRRVSANFDDMELGAILESVLRGSDMTYRFVDDYILIVPEHVQATDTVRKPLTVSGRVTDEKKEALPGVTIVVKGTTSGVTTDIDGNYSIVVPNPDSTVLVFSFIGMEKQELTVNGRTELNVIMIEDVHELAEVKVINNGIFSRPKENFTGAATEFTGEEIRAISKTNILSALKVLDASFQMPDDNISSLSAGANISILSRPKMKYTSRILSQTSALRHDCILQLLYFICMFPGIFFLSEMPAYCRSCVHGLFQSEIFDDRSHAQVEHL